MKEDRAVEILGAIPVDLDRVSVRARFKAADSQSIGELIEQALSLAEARAVFTAAYIEKRGPDQVVIDGRGFKSRVLSQNLQDVGRVFPAVVTIGSHLEDAARGSEDVLTQYWLDQIGNFILAAARSHLRQRLCRQYALDTLSWMSPGSLEDWPLDAQRPLFDLLGDAPAAIGVQLTDSLLMLPAKSVSGIFFPSTSTFFSCRLCRRERCEGRKASFDEAAAREYGIHESAPARRSVRVPSPLAHAHADQADFE